MTSGSSSLLVDSNILIYAFDAAEPAKRQHAMQVVERLGMSGRGAVSVQILGEVYYTLTRKSRLAMSAPLVEEALNGLISRWLVLDLTQAVFHEAVRLSQRYQLAYWDGLLLAAARLNDIATLLSEDMQDGASIDGVRILNPLIPNFDLHLLS